MCRFHEQGFCRNGKFCNFAHHQVEVYLLGGRAASVPVHRNMHIREVKERARMDLSVDIQRLLRGKTILDDEQTLEMAGLWPGESGAEGVTITAIVPGQGMEEQDQQEGVG